MITRAIERAKTLRESHGLKQENTAAGSIYLLDISAVEFNSYLAALWNQFHVAYTRTPDCWSEQLTAIQTNNRALDLARLALATLRLSISDQRKEYRVFALSAYDASLRAFRRILQDHQQSSKQLQVVLSTLFALFEGAQETPTSICSSGWAGHLAGAVMLLQQQDPRSFAAGILHAVFKKLREMIVSLPTEPTSRPSVLFSASG